MYYETADAAVYVRSQHEYLEIGYGRNMRLIVSIPRRWLFYVHYDGSVKLGSCTLTAPHVGCIMAALVKLEAEVSVTDGRPPHTGPDGCCCCWLL